MPNRKRIVWITKHRIQAKYLFIVLLAMLLPTYVLGFCLYRVVFALLERQIAFPEAIASNLLPVIERVNSVLIMTLPVMTLVLLVTGLVISHRFAGPIERVESELDRILAGDLKHRIRTRKHDDLQGIAGRINALLDKLAV